MNKNTINISHLLDPAPLGLDDVYGDRFNALEAMEHGIAFHEKNKKLIVFFNTSSLEDAIYVLIRVYKDKYPTSQILNIYSYSTKSHAGIDKRTDLEINWHTERNKIDQITITLKEEHDISVLKTLIEEVLNDKNFDFSDNTFKINNSPINTISISNNEIEIKIHPSEVINY